MFKQMFLAAKAGGVVALKELDSGMHCFHPENEGLRMYLDVYPKFVRGKQGDPHVGRKLVRYELGAGFARENIDCSIGNWTVSTPEERKAWTDFIVESFGNLDLMSQLLEASGEDANRDLSMIGRGFQVWSEHSDAFFGMLSPQVVCRKGT